jgi:hypothetical protein
MAISGIQVINIGLPNESIGSDSLYTAFNKSKDNFTQLFACASPYNTFTGNGVTISNTSSTGTVNIDANVRDIAAGAGILVESANGVFTITNTGSGNGGGAVTSVGVNSSTLAVSNSPITTAGSIVVNLQALNPTPAGTYTNPEVTIDQFGRVTNIANGTTSGTVTSVAVTPGAGIQVTGSPITTSGTINIVNTGVTRLSAGTGISLSGSNGAVTIATTTTGGTVTGVTIASNALVVTGSPITDSGIITVDLPANITATGNLVGGNISTAGTLTATGSITSSGDIITTGGRLSMYRSSGTSYIDWGTGQSLSFRTETSASGAGATEVMRLDTGGSIPAFIIAGSMTANSTGGIGYSTGAGGTVTQITSRTTGVTINKISGSITLVSAAGSASYASFTVTNSTVAATDVIIVNQKSGTDKYEAWISNVAAGSFQITFADTSGTTTEQPVFNFAVIKAVAA